MSPTKIADLFVDLKLDDSTFGGQVKLALLKAQRAAGDVKLKVDVDTADATAKVRRATRNATAKVKVDADTKGADAAIKRTARTRDSKIKVKADTKDAERSLDTYTGRLGVLASAIIGLGPATIPVLGAVTGGVAALSGALLTAGGVGAVFGLSFQQTATQMKKQQTNITNLKTQIEKTATTSKNYAILQGRLKDAQHAYNQEFGPAARGMDNYKRAMADFLKKTDPTTTLVMAKGLGLINSVLPKLVPLSNAAGTAIGKLIDDLRHWADGPEFKALLSMLEKRGPKALTTFAHSAGHILHGVLGLIEAFVPSSQGMLDGIDKLTAGFDRWGTGFGKTKAFRDFLKYARQNGPKIGHLLEDIATAVGHVVQALMPSGGVTLDLIDKLAKYTAGMSPAHIAAVAGAVGALGLATGKFGKLTSLSLLIDAVTYAYKHSKAFKTLADDAGRLAKALNNLPTAAKLAGVAAIASLFLGTRGGGKGGKGGIISKLTGGGVQKVFVVNMGKGGGGGGFDPFSTATKDAEKGGSKVKSGGRFVRFAKGAAEFGGALLSPEIVIPAALTVGQIALIAKLSQASAPVQSDNMRYRPPANSGPTAKLGPQPFLSGGLSKLGILMEKAVPGAKNYNDALGKMNGWLVKLEHANPSKGFAAMQQIMKATGLTVGQLKVLFPQAVAGMKNVGEVAHTSSKKFGNFYDAAWKSGLSLDTFRKHLKGLPAYVQTKILTPGALKSRQDVKDLAKQFGLTPKQIKTIMTLAGITPARRHLSNVKGDISALNNTKAKPRVELQGYEDSVKKSKLLINAYGLIPKQVLSKAQFDAAKAKAADDAYREYVNKNHGKQNLLSRAAWDSKRAATLSAAYRDYVNANHGKQNLLSKAAWEDRQATAGAKNFRIFVNAQHQKQNLLSPAQWADRKARGDVSSYKDYVNYQLSKIHANPIKLRIDQKSMRIVNAAHAKNVHAEISDLMGVGGYKVGGGVFGPGSETSDSILARLSHNEHVWTAKEVKAAGGHGAVEDLRKAVLTQHRYATGGPVVQTPVVHGGRFSVAPVNQALSIIASSLGRVLGPPIQRLLSMGGGRHRPVHGGVITQGIHDAYTGFPAIDFGVPVGTPVYAGASGKVIVSRDLIGGQNGGYRSYGRYIEIDSGKYETLYAHLSKRLVRSGQFVSGGQRIGLSGNTGHSTGPHLHFGAHGISPLAFLHNTAGGLNALSTAGGNHLSPAAARAAAFSMMPGSWSRTALNDVVMRESGWRWNAKNPSSSAYGIPQALPGSKMASAGSDWHDNALTQIKWMLGYIKERYRNPSGALAHERSVGWYDNGGWLKRGATMAMNGTGKPEAVLTDRQWASMERMLAVMEKQVASGRVGAPLIAHAVIRETVDLERYERQRAFRDRKTRI